VYSPSCSTRRRRGLRLRRHVADLVEEERAGGRLLEAADAARQSAGEGALFMTEQLAFDEFAGNRRHINGDEGPVPTLTVVVERPRHQFLAGAGLARDHHRQVRLHQPGQHAVDVLHGRRAADERQALFVDPGLPVVEDRMRLRQRLLDDTDQLVQIERLRQIVEGAALVGAHGRQQRVLRAHDDDAQVRTALADARHQVEAVLVGHDDVGDNEVADAVVDPLPERRRGAGRAHFVTEAAQGLIEHGPDGAVVVGDQDRGCAHASSSAIDDAAGSSLEDRPARFAANSMTPP
jgi:hypothetical protein